MASMIKITGMRQVLSNMKKATGTFGKKFERGCKNAGLFVQRESQKIVPVDTGNLKGGAFTRNVGGKEWDVDVIVGYVADYAVYVHEDLDAKHNPGQRAKYLEAVFKEQRDEIFRIVAAG